MTTWWSSSGPGSPTCAGGFSTTWPPHCSTTPKQTPTKRTTVARFATHPHWYAAAWPIAGAAVGAGVAATTLPELWPSVVGALLAAASALAARPDDLASVTRSEIVSVLVVMIGGLVSAALMYPPLAWMAVVPALLLPLDAAVGRRAVAQPS